MGRATERSGNGIMGRFAFRFSDRKPRDVALSRWIAEDIASGEVNVSEVAKDLLYDWYLQRKETGESLTRRAPGPSPNGGQEWEDPTDPLVQRMAGLSFEELW